MQVQRSLSWRFVQTVDERPHVALYVRDALRLDVPAGSGIPPRLVAAVPDRSDLLDAATRATAGAQWASWWHALVAAEARRHQGPAGADHKEWLRGCAAQLRATGDPPGFAQLSDRAALRSAVLATFAEADAWAKDVGRTAQPPAVPPTFTWAMTKQVAEDVAFDRAVDIAAVQAVAMVLAVAGSWWQLLAPGVLFCSSSVSQDPTVAEASLRAAFESGLTR